jgi:5-methylcytosine-specific restriction endonuclease McrA
MREHDDSRKTMRPKRGCLDCGAPIEDRGAYCGGCMPEHTRVKRGYGRDHQRKRARMLKAGARCEMCGGDQDLRLDHILPRSMGGDDYAENMRVLCVSCHAKHGVQSNRTHNHATLGLRGTPRGRRQSPAREAVSGRSTPVRGRAAATVRP